MRVLLSEAQVRDGVRRMAEAIAQHYGQRPLTIIGVLTGSVVLLADLIRQLDMPLRVGVVQARSYRGSATTPGPLSMQLDLLPEIRGRELLVVDDIFDTGQTMFELLGELDALGPRGVRSAVLLRKVGRSRITRQPDFVGFEIPDVFVVGYGLDYQDNYRHLPYVAALEDHEIKSEHGP